MNSSLLNVSVAMVSDPQLTAAPTVAVWPARDADGRTVPWFIHGPDYHGKLCETAAISPGRPPREGSVGWPAARERRDDTTIGVRDPIAAGGIRPGSCLHTAGSSS